MTDTNDTMTIRQMCEAFGVTPRTLRFYEAKELLAPVRAGTRRSFTRQDRTRLTSILRAKRFGFSLEEIRQLLALGGRGTMTAEERARILELGRARLARMEEERRDLDRAVTELRARLDDGPEGFARYLGSSPEARAA